MRQPEVFKMACLRDIQRVFGESNRNPFYAGFGNRITDALSYRSVNVPSGRIFTIDSSGEVKMELLGARGLQVLVRTTGLTIQKQNNAQTDHVIRYIHMTDLVDQMFPPIHRKWAPEFTDVNFWRTPVGEYDPPEEPAPPSPALSARSDASGQTRLSRLRNFNLLPGSATVAVSAVSRTSTAPNPNGHSRHTSASSSLASESTLAQNARQRRLSNASIPGTLEGFHLDDGGDGDEEGEDGEDEEDEEDEEGDEYEEEGDEYEYEEEDEDEGEDGGGDEQLEYADLLEMDKVPFL
jgi:phosphatidate phosphatase LPIN